ADIVFRRNGTASLVVVEVKSGDGRLTPQQLEKLAEAARTGKIYIVNEQAADAFKIKPNVTFADQGTLPEVLVLGGNLDAIAKQLRNQGLEVVPRGGRRGGGPAGLRVLRPN